MINLQISESYTGAISPEILIRAAQETLIQAAAPDDVELTLVLESSEYLQELNKQFRQIDAPTDVLSFPADEEMADPESNLTYLGDIIVSVQQAQTQAERAGHSLGVELQLLTVHGVLHLLGYDHADRAQKRAMWQIQAEILKTIGAEIKKLPED